MVENGAIVIGDDSFLDKLAGVPQKHEDDADLKKLELVIDGEGNIQGDTSHIPAEILAQLQSPESKAKMAAQYRASRYHVEPSKAKRFLNPLTQADVQMGKTFGIEPQQLIRRNLSSKRMPGQSRQEFRAMKSKVFKSLRKQAIRNTKG